MSHIDATMTATMAAIASLAIASAAGWQTTCLSYGVPDPGYSSAGGMDAFVTFEYANCRETAVFPVCKQGDVLGMTEIGPASISVPPTSELTGEIGDLPYLYDLAGDSLRLLPWEQTTSPSCPVLAFSRPNAAGDIVGSVPDLRFSFCSRQGLLRAVGIWSLQHAALWQRASAMGRRIVISPAADLAACRDPAATARVTPGIAL